MLFLKKLYFDHLTRKNNRYTRMIKKYTEHIKLMRKWKYENDETISQLIVEIQEEENKRYKVM